MRQKRAKAYKKQMATYERTFQFRTPYQILITADFLMAARSFHLDPFAGLKRTVQGDTKPMISQCCMKSLYDADDQAEIALARKGTERRRCGHIETPETPYDCVMACVGSRNKNRYVVATQDVALRKRLREVPGVPLIYINRSVVILEPPSPATLHIKEERERGKTGVSAEEAAVLLGKRKRGSVRAAGVTTTVVAPTRGSDGEESNGSGDDNDTSEGGAEGGTGAREGLVTATTDRPRKKRKGPSGPNPLSAKKPKRSTATVDDKPRREATRDPAISLATVVAKGIGGPSGVVENAAGAGGGTSGGTVAARNRRKRKHKSKTSSSGGDAAESGGAHGLESTADAQDES